MTVAPRLRRQSRAEVANVTNNGNMKALSIWKPLVIGNTVYLEVGTTRQDLVVRVVFILFAQGIPHLSPGLGESLCSKYTRRMYAELDRHGDIIGSSVAGVPPVHEATFRNAKHRQIHCSQRHRLLPFASTARADEGSSIGNREQLRCTMNVQLPSSWLVHPPRYQLYWSLFSRFRRIKLLEIFHNPCLCTQCAARSNSQLRSNTRLAIIGDTPHSRGHGYESTR